MSDPVIWTTKKAMLDGLRIRMKGVKVTTRTPHAGHVFLTAGYDGLTLDNGLTIFAEVAEVWHGAKFAIDGYLLKQLLNRLAGECIVMSFQGNFTLRLENAGFRVDLILPFLELSESDTAGPQPEAPAPAAEPEPVPTPAQPAKPRTRRPTKRFQNVMPVYTVPTAVFAKTGGI